MVTSGSFLSTFTAHSHLKQNKTDWDKLIKTSNGIERMKKRIIEISSNNRTDMRC